MELEKIQKLEQSIDNLKNKNARIYFLVQDTKGNPKHLLNKFMLWQNP